MDRTTVIDVDGMTCMHCVKAVTTEVSAVDGVLDVSVTLSQEKPSAVTVVSTEVLDRAALRAAVDEAGYTAVAIHDGDN
jgi:copper chaperone